MCRMLTMCIVLALMLTTLTMAANPQVKLVTTKGDIILELYPDKAPKTVENFLNYVDLGFYNGLIFHRVIKGFMIQGGGMTTKMERKETLPPIQNEADNGLKNDRGTIAMARQAKPHTATSQFFINTVDNIQLNFKNKQSTGGWGYCVFGKVIQGMNVVDAIENLPTGKKEGYNDVPKIEVVIKKAELIKK
jgi:cyclophilin family peptidyl-prolyl cis-trans isomerase